MKNISRAFCFFAFVLIVSCNNEKTESTTKTAPATTTPAPAEKKDPKTEISVGPDGGSVKTKDASIRINTQKDTTKH